jgi:hypothetical protein
LINWKAVFGRKMEEEEDVHGHTQVVILLQTPVVAVDVFSKSHRPHPQ